MAIVPKRQILVVEDNTINREMLTAILEDTYTVFAAENGREALDILRSHAGSISLILLDLIMPVMDGYEFLDTVRPDPELSLIPVIVMTQNNSVQDEVDALARGATDFVPKPYHPKVVLHRIASIIKLRECSAMVESLKFDRLTGVYSKEYFYEKVRRTLREDPDHNYSIVCSNIENFKMINDSFGMQEGDRLLREVASRTQLALGSTGFCGRFSADRFLCMQRSDAAHPDWEELIFPRGTAKEPILRSTVIRWGIYEIRDRTIPVELMCDRALMAVNSIKGQFDRYSAVYDDSLRRKSLREQALTSAMAEALGNGEFQVYFQPKIELKSGALAGAEALTRWFSPQLGTVSPAEFVPLFERNGFVFQLDRFVWETTCRMLHQWQLDGHRLVPVSVNISRADLYHTELVDTLPWLIKQYDIDPKYLHLEITESAYMRHPVKIAENMGQLRDYGFPVEMDDFGSGYSSLSIFGQMKLDILKLDMNFVRNETAKPAIGSILTDVINMAHRMGLRVVAEGVEQKGQADRLLDADCDYVQGYLFAKPMPADDFARLLTEADNAPAQPVAVPVSTARRLLAADEDEAFLKKIAALFAEDFQVLQYHTPEEALRQIRDFPSSPFSAVILSATFPEGGSEQILRELRHSPASREVPVLITLPDPAVAEGSAHDLMMHADDFLCKCHPLSDLRRRICRILDVAELRQHEKALSDEVARDPMTGLLNRRGLDNALRKLCASDYPLAVCMFDLDNLKYINDTFGHAAGDRVILNFAEFLRQKAGENILCRYGGDEFLAILTRTGEPEQLRQRILGICRGFMKRFTKDSFSASCSAGVSLCFPDEGSTREVLQRADAALYRAKREKVTLCLMEDK